MPDIITIAYFTVGYFLAIYIIMFAICSVIEKQKRAFFTSLVICIIFLAFWLLYFKIFQSDLALLFPLSLIIVSLITFFMPLGKIECLNSDIITEKVDERDTMFAREEYEEGSEKYRKYYEDHTERKEIDDRIRDLPPILEKGGIYYQKDVSEKVKSTFKKISMMATRVDGTVSKAKKDSDPLNNTKTVKKILGRLGADEAGITELNNKFVYSHVGRGPEKWGSKIENNHKYAIIFTIEMNYENVQRAPDVSITKEAADKYLTAAKISIGLAKYIRLLGHSARAHISDSNYQIMLPPIAQDAGLGEVGRMGYLISQKYGGRVRLGGVTTDIPLVTDKPKAFGVQNFCKDCQKCAENCPSGAIPLGDKINVRGAMKWQLKIENCIHYWRKAGTDCGICMKVCPYSHPDNIFHNIVRYAIKRSSIARKLSIAGDDFLYGRKTDYKF